MITHRQDQSTFIALLAFFCAIFFTATIVFAHVFTEKLSPLSSTLSLYALEEHGYILELGFCAIGLTQVLLAFILFSQAAEQRLILIPTFFALAAIGAIAVAAFPTLPAPASIADRLPHIIAAVMQFLFFPLAAFMLSFQMKHGFIKAYTWVTGLMTALLFMVMLIFFLSPSLKNFAYFGLIEKIDILAINFWLVFICFVLYVKSGESF